MSRTTRAYSALNALDRRTLSRRDRTLITVADLVALKRSTELPFQVRVALENGVSRRDVVELVAALATLVPLQPPSV